MTPDDGAEAERGHERDGSERSGTPGDPAAGSGRLSGYLRRALTLGAVGLLFVGGALILRHLANVLLVIFGAILGAVVLGAAATWLSDRTPLPRPLALLLVILAGVGTLVGFGWAAGPQVAEQTGQLAERLPELIRETRRDLLRSEWGRPLLEQLGQDGGVPGMEFLGGISGVFSTVLGAVTNLLVLLVVAIYLSVSPGVYMRAAVRMVPKPGRDRAWQVLTAIGHALTRWMLGRLASMAVVGGLTAAGLFIVGVPLSLALGLIAGILSFVPFIGPILAAVPGLLIAGAESLRLAIFAGGVYVVVQLVETYLVTPMIQRRAVFIPPAFLILAQVLMGVLFGILGVFLATPFTVAVVVAVQMLYVEDLLEDEVRVLGGGEDERERADVPA